MTEGHVHQIQNNPVIMQGKVPEALTAQQLIVETDSTMILIVNTDKGDDSDKRKNRKVCWKEVRLGLNPRFPKRADFSAINLSSTSHLK